MKKYLTTIIAVAVLAAVAVAAVIILNVTNKNKNDVPADPTAIQEEYVRSMSLNVQLEPKTTICDVALPWWHFPLAATTEIPERVLLSLSIETDFAFLVVEMIASASDVLLVLSRSSEREFAT